MTSKLITGAEWLDKLNLDILYHVCWFLDVQSITRLAWSCKALNDFIAESRLLWLRALRTAPIAPHSFDHLTTASQIRRAATRDCRLQSALLSPTIPESLRVVNYLFNHHNVLGHKPLAYFEPFLLPGGRWLLTYVFQGRDSYVLCWDTSPNECGDGETQVIRPVAHCILPSFIVDQLRGAWAQIQCEPSTETVNIAIRLMPLDAGIGRVHQVLQLSWSESEPSRPLLAVRATLEDDRNYLDDSGPREYSLEGDFIAIDSLQGILIWNWKEDTICSLDPQGREWADGSGFLLNLQPPFIYIIPHELLQILAVRIPELVPRGHPQYTFPSPQVVVHPFLARSVIGLNHSGLDVPDKWLPYALRHGFATLTINRNPRCIQQILRFPPASDPTAPPSFAAQQRQRFAGIRLHLLNTTAHDATCTAVSIQRRTKRAQNRTASLEVAIHKYPFSEINSNFADPVSRTFAVNALDGDTWSNSGKIGPICVTSGTILLTHRTGDAVAIIRYD